MTTYSINDIDITNDVISGSFNYIARNDNVYGQGSLHLESKTLNENMPPYSILRVNEDFYCCSSEATYHFGNKSWFHNVSVIEITSLLSRYLLGTKSFSNTGTHKQDWEKVDIILALIEQRYKVMFAWYVDYKKILNGSNEYSFGAGTTLFDALDEIFSRYNYRISVNYFDSSDNMIYLDAINVGQNGLVDTSELNMLSMTKSQNAETYCKYLETEGNNIVETNRTATSCHIFPSSNDIKVSLDTMILKTPTPMQELISLNLHYNVTLKTKLQSNLISANNYQYEGSTKTFAEWVSIFPSLIEVFNAKYSTFFDLSYFEKTTWIATADYLTPIQNTDGSSAEKEIPNGKYKIDLTNHILSKEQYELLEDKNKPDYAYYTYGSNVIDGFNVFYKNDFWNTIIGQDKTPFIQTIKIDYNVGENTSIGDWYLDTYYILEDVNPLKSTYVIEYIALGNPYIRVVKENKPLNESKYKPYSISFNKSGNQVDFDKLHKVMNKENASMGVSERIVEYQAPLNHKVQYFGTLYFDNLYWYINTCEIMYNATSKVIRYSVRTAPTNKADSVVLNSQYNTLKNPIDSIVERPIYAEIDNEFEFNKDTYLTILFKTYSNADTDIWSYTIWVKPILFENNGDKFLYVEMLDQYSAGQYAEEINAEQTALGVYKKVDARYVDGNNEIFKVAFNFADMVSHSYSDIKYLPTAPDAWRVFGEKKMSYRSMPVYKDAREKLTFTIKANNCIIK